MPNSLSWLSDLTIAQLRRIAFLTGSASSGTKPVLIKSIQTELYGSPWVGHSPYSRQSSGSKEQTKPTSHIRPNQISLVSIDMGIRNLAYAHLLVDVEDARNAANDNKFPMFKRPQLISWKRITLSDAFTKRSRPINSKSGKGSLSRLAQELNYHSGSDNAKEPLEPSTTSSATESDPFNPQTFASHAYSFVKTLLSTQNPRPTHILIERQRFRSASAPTVQEPSLNEFFVTSVDPGRVSRYWLEGKSQTSLSGTGNAKAKGKEGKKAKIDIVGRALESSSNGISTLVDLHPTSASGAAVEHETSTTVSNFLSKWKGAPRMSRKKHKAAGNAMSADESNGTPKLDDLADSLLQGVAWLNWQNKRREVLRHGIITFEDDPAFIGKPPRRNKAKNNRKKEAQ